MKSAPLAIVPPINSRPARRLEGRVKFTRALTPTQACLLVFALAQPVVTPTKPEPINVPLSILFGPNLLDPQQAVSALFAEDKAGLIIEETHPNGRLVREGAYYFLNFYSYLEYKEGADFLTTKFNSCVSEYRPEILLLLHRELTKTDLWQGQPVPVEMLLLAA